MSCIDILKHTNVPMRRLQFCKHIPKCRTNIPPPSSGKYVEERCRFRQNFGKYV